MQASVSEKACTLHSHQGFWEAFRNYQHRQVQMLNYGNVNTPQKRCTAMWHLKQTLSFHKDLIWMAL